MKVFAIVPVKELSASKRQRSVMLNPEERSSLTAAMLEDVLKTLKSSMISEIIIVGADSVAQQVADKHGASYLSKGRAGLDRAVKKAVEWCMRKKADAVLVLPANVPLASSKDIDRIVELGSEEPSVVLSPSLNGGMNALFLNPSNVIQASFGPNCFFQNVEAAIKKDVIIRFYSSRDIAMDVDSEEDLQRLLETENCITSKQAFQKIMRKEEKN
jgi:2-phospho-L-lactate guanylyltransferase